MIPSTVSKTASTNQPPHPELPTFFTTLSVQPHPTPRSSRYLPSDEEYETQACENPVFVEVLGLGVAGDGWGWTMRSRHGGFAWIDEADQ